MKASREPADDIEDSENESAIYGGGISVHRPKASGFQPQDLRSMNCSKKNLTAL